MNNCVMCGVSIPEGQSTCSMCYGDPYHGSDGYYLEWLQQAEQEALEEAQWEDEMEKLQNEDPAQPEEE